ncbi:MAG: alpha/beta hydrolase, partial [Nonomuraea sp.]|nr:alpha/beta hydrolase [Nonomuraea sp.]NUP83751.1 alpha/beta hydrolase [Nonomuraea sp.]NUR83085.1 alpha/beta hydrolase [Nonomuraea sp.]NUS06890.1 alpha/beta hydrolase [Nonomuraea sp.]
ASVAAFYRELFEKELAGWPAEVREPLIDYHVSARGLRNGLLEASNVDDLHAEIRAAGPLPDVPLVILASDEVDPFKEAMSGGVPESLLREEIEAKFGLYAAFARSVPRGEARRVPGGHATIHLRGERAVMAAIEELLQV